MPESSEDKSSAEPDITSKSTVDGEKAPHAVAEAASVPVSAPAASPVASATAPAAKRGNPLVLLLVALAGVGVVTIITCDIFEQKLPNFLIPVEPVLDKHIRYAVGYADGTKDWRGDLLVEQNIWTNEVNKIRLGQATAKPEMYKRDYLFYLADSYFKDDPHYAQAKAAYLAGRAEPRIAHSPGYDISDADLCRKIGYSAMRMGEYAEADQNLKQAIALYDAEKDPARKGAQGGAANLSMDILTESAIRQNHLEEAQNLLNQRLKRINCTDIDGSVEPYMLFNNALLLEKKGDKAGAEKFYKQAIAQHEHDDKNRAVISGGQNDNNRMLAYVLREYARFLRTQKRFDESFNAMDRACTILNNAP